MRRQLDWRRQNDGSLLLPAASRNHRPSNNRRIQRSLRWRNRTGRKLFRRTQKRKARTRRQGKSRCLRPFEAWRQGLREGHPRRGIGNADADYREKSRSRQHCIVYTDCWKGYNALDVSRFKHYRINHSVLFADEENHINGIENFWNQAKRHLRKYNGIPRVHFPLYLKECEWRFNNPSPHARFVLLKQWVRKHMG